MADLIKSGENPQAAGTVTYGIEGQPAAFTLTSGGNLTVTGTLTASGGQTITGNETVNGQLSVTSAQPTSGVVVITDTVDNGSDGVLHIENFDAASRTMGVRVTGEAQQRFVMFATGQQQFGAGGASARDTNLGRAGAGVLYTDKNLLVGSATPLGDNGVGEIQLAAASPVPSVAPTGGGVIYATNSGGLVFFDNNGQYNPLIAGAQTASTTAGALAETMHVYTASGSSSPTSGTLFIQKVFLAAGQTVGHIGFVTSTTAANGPTNWWCALLDNTYKQRAHSADQLTAAIPASTWQNLAMVTPYTTAYSGAYYLAFMIKTSTTQPTLATATTAPLTVFVTGTNAPTPFPNGASTAALTSPGTDGTTVYAAPTATSAPFYMYCSS